MTHHLSAARCVVAGLGLVVASGCAVPATPQERAAAPSPASQRTAATAPAADPAVAGTSEPAESPLAEAVAEQPTRPAAAAPRPKQPPLLQDAGDGDGDSWHDTAGTEYRLGLVNTPERAECYGREATAERKARTAAGFRATTYSTDDYGRSVAVVTTAAGINLNVHLARNGFADDRYLARFRHENRSLAKQLDEAFAAAKREGAGLWSVCQQPVQGVAAPPPTAAEPAGDGCHPDYATCIPVQGDGSGRGQANDLDCGDLSGPVRLRTVGVDPYRLDADRDGVGCD